MVQEADMIPIIEKYFSDMGYFTFTEVSVGGAGHGVADVVAVKINLDKVIQRIRNNQYDSIKNEVLAELLRFITEDNKGTQLKKIKKRFSYSTPYLKRNLINKLIEGHFIVETEGNTYRKINNIVPLASEVIAVEAKKEAWIAATQQAKRYQSYANRTYVALLKEYGHRVECERLKRNNIGLITVDMKTDSAKIIWKSRYRKPLNENIKFLAHEAIWRRMRPNIEMFIGEGENINELARV
ncbi:hypothetical protein [Aneurinibacillus terranovensis]|uniref:hypothetical protein n=1 Tax=Aneurinibacillus terranovensis TaxID=278991 RepID=UPI00040F16C9|nr:hypothetical protein [Aneurinibacillus terranovensis]